MRYHTVDNFAHKELIVAGTNHTWTFNQYYGIFYDNDTAIKVGYDYCGSRIACYHTYSSNETDSCSGSGWGSPGPGIFSNDYFDSKRNHHHCGSPYHRGTYSGILLQGGSTGPNWYELVGLPLSAAGLYFGLVPTPSTAITGNDIQGSSAEYHSIDTTYWGWGPEMNVGSYWDRPTWAGIFSPLLRSSNHFHFAHGS